MTYNPEQDPLDLPFMTLTAHCRAENVIDLPPIDGATPGTSLFGGFGEQLVKLAKPDCVTNCLMQGSGCKKFASCATAWLYKPYSIVHRRNFQRPVFLSARELENHIPVRTFTINLTLWGRHALEYRQMVVQILTQLSNHGLLSQGQLQRFSIDRWSQQLNTTLAEHAQLLSQQALHNLLLFFETPLRYREKVWQVSGKTKNLWMAGGQVPMLELVGNSAYELAAWDIEDRQLLDLDKDQRHHLCEQARQKAIQVMLNVAPLSSLLYPVKSGKRYSRSGAHYFPLDGFTGYIELGGELTAALPWLLALALQGGGQNRAMGFGRMRFWLNAINPLSLIIDNTNG